MFTAVSKHGELIYQDGQFLGHRGYAAVVDSFIETGAEVATIELGPTVRAAAEPEWVAWFTARAALEAFDDLVWSESPPMPREVFLTPPGAVA